jgi:SpoVK/Ycf46/Vps4 family AAA+-type ATPase|tara:strand:- start:10118 stop:11581 length:1464 start_codon:yes stop_codon:yes gene_type:complete
MQNKLLDKTVHGKLSENANYICELYNSELERRKNGQLPKGVSVPHFFSEGENEVKIERFWGISFSVSKLVEAKEYCKKNKLKKTVGIINIEEVSDVVAFDKFFFDLEYNSSEKSISNYDSTGVFRIDLNDGDFLYIAQWAAGDGRETVADAVVISTLGAYSKLREALNKQDVVRSIVKKGVYRLREQNGIPIYTKIKDMQQTPVIHPEKDRAVSLIKNFFNNVEHFVKDGRSGTRKGIWIGPPGTGKTSLSRQILRDYGKKFNVCITTDLGACYLHMVKSAKSKKPTIIVLEDAENSLSKANSDVLNVLDGIDLPRNPAGTYIIMTTNKPQMIEKRILMRPGRIDDWCFFGALKGKNALQCAKFYFSSTLYKGLLTVEDKEGQKTVKTVKGKETEVETLDEGLLSIVSNGKSGMSGAQIAGLADSMISFSISKNKPVSVELIHEAKNEMEGYLKSIDTLIKEEGMLKDNELGFNLDQDDGKNNFKSW